MESAAVSAETIPGKFHLSKSFLTAENRSKKAYCSKSKRGVTISVNSLPGQTLRARFTSTGDERNTRGRAKGDERKRSADSEQVSVGSAGMLAEPIRLQQSCDSVLIR